MIARQAYAILSPSDMTASTACLYGWLRDIDIRLGRAELIETADAFADRIARLGDEHEQREREALERTHTLVSAPGPDRWDTNSLTSAAAQTATLLHDGADAVAQAVFFDGGMAGRADFVVRHDDGRYQVWDAKLARREKVSAVLQLAAYADQLDLLGVPRHPEGVLLLGDGTRASRPLDDAVAVYRHRRRLLEDVVARHVEGGRPVTWDDGAGICGSCPHCTAAIADHDDLLKVAGLTRLQRQRLRAGGIATATALATSQQTMPQISASAWERLRTQAALQHATPDGEVAVELVDAGPIDRLPPPDLGDIFFDFEGDPLWTDGTGAVVGLEYLFGLVEVDSGTEVFRPLWAHDLAEERDALVAFLDYVTERRRHHPELHIYHYASYEVTALKRLTTRHAVGEAALDQLLRDGVFVDLYSTVRQSIRTSQRSLSIKKLEPLYMGEDMRDDDGVTTAVDSVIQYEEWMSLRRLGADEEAARVLAAIADYNAYDCISTHRLRNWLRLRRTRDLDGGAPVASGEDVGQVERAVGRLDELQRSADRLLASVPTDPADRDAEQQGRAMLAAALGFHRREAKPMWWAYFDRFTSPVDEWQDRRHTLVADSVVVLCDWYREGKQQNERRMLRLSGVLEPGSDIVAGATVRLVYEDVPAEWPLDGQSRRAATKDKKVRAVEVRPDGTAVVEIEETRDKGSAAYDELPMAAFAFTLIAPDALEAATAGAVEDAAAGDGLPQDPASDVLARRLPRLAGHDLATAGETVTADELARAVAALDDSYLAVQGPPGTGKTYVGARAVAQLTQQGWRIGVVAQGHATVEHFLDAVVDAGLEAARVCKAPRTGQKVSGGRWTAVKDLPMALTDVTGGVVVGGTAWGFARLPVRELDLLVIDEAGQYSLAMTVPVARAAKRLLLLGDPQQLPQVSKGSHPEPVQTSALGWLMEGHDTLPPELGFFLSRTWRMHSALTAPVSTLAYEGRLRSQVEVTDARELVGIEPGLHPVPVRHAGNSASSVEEAGAVVDVVRGVIGRRWLEDMETTSRPLTAADVIVITPYNAQVATIRQALDRAGLGGTRVGTVDRFQGQEAVISIVSMAASSAADVPRGLEFLLDRNRLNVAISRGQWASFLVHSPALGDAVPTTVGAIGRLGAFLRLVERDG